MFVADCKRLFSRVRSSVSAIVLYELWYGIKKSARPQKNAAALSTFLALDVTLWPFELEDAEEAGDIRAELERAGTPIGPYDILIAAQARRRSALLVTANVSEFSRVPGLRTRTGQSAEGGRTSKTPPKRRLFLIFEQESARYSTVLLVCVPAAGAKRAFVGLALWGKPPPGLRALRWCRRQALGPPPLRRHALIPCAMLGMRDAALMPEQVEVIFLITNARENR